MAITTRQTSLLVAEDWTKLYQTFREADFQSYDFQTIRKSMIDYLRLYYPEDFNDYTESSEFIALIDLIAFLGQSLAFRTDLNARENFIDTAERRDSILKLARLISYNPKRNLPSTGFLKFDSVTTTESVTDSNGLNLANLPINWNDVGNDNWLEQFTAVLNAALIDSQVVGKPGNSQVLFGVRNDEYTVNLVPNVIPTYTFASTVEGTAMDFEAVSATSANSTYIYEVDPKPKQAFNILYKNDNLGNASNNTGFFVYFKQGDLKSVDFSLAESLPNRSVSINFDNINNTDVWLYALDTNNKPTTLWTKVPAVAGINVIYNEESQRNLYQVNSRANDQIDLVFGDGSFSNIPQGNFRLFYRQSNGLSYKVTPDELQGIVIPINYVSRTGRVETLTIRASLHYTVTNASARESLNDIRQKAPQQYYTQNRMITGEDYNIVPYTSFSNLLKVKTVNRTSSGISRYLDVLDTTGKYSSTNIFADDGLLYKENFIKSFSFAWTTTNDIFKVVYNQIIPILQSKETQHFYYAYFNRYQAVDTFWTEGATVSNGSSGFFNDSQNNVWQVGQIVTTNLQYIVPGALMYFTAPNGFYFNGQNQLIAGTPQFVSDKTFIYATVLQVYGDGSNNREGLFSDGTGPIVINQTIPTGAILSSIIPVFKNDFSAAFTQSVVGLIQTYKNFGIRYDVSTTNWVIVNAQDLDLTSPFSLSNAGDTSGQGLDASWLIAFSFDGTNYSVQYRGLNYIFESVLETRFYFDDKVKVYDSKTGRTIFDQIKVLKMNSQPDSPAALGADATWHVYKPIVETDGFINPNRILVTFPDTNNDGVPDNPDLFETIVAPEVNPNNKFVFFQSVTDGDSFVNLVPIDNSMVVTKYGTLLEIQTNASSYSNGQVFYATVDQLFYVLTVSTDGTQRTITQSTQYTAMVGRQSLYFQYRHNSPDYRRIDPSPANLMDMYLLTQAYEDSYRAWIQDTSGTVVEPSTPSNEELSSQFGSLSQQKAVSDAIVFNSAKFKPLFGSKAPLPLQATFKVVKNPNINISDNDVKTSVITAINNFFDISNWDFGETFYFSELSAYLHSTLTPTLASIIIVPVSTDISFGSMYQVNAEPNEIIVSAATVDNVQVISAITAAQINQNLSSINSNINL